MAMNPREGQLLQTDLSRLIDNEDMEMLVLKNRLPNLTSIDLPITEDSVTSGVLLRIFEKVRLTLKELSICSDSALRENPVSFGLPIMEKLEVFETFSEGFVPESIGVPPLETFLPKLRRIHFYDHPYDMIKKWTHGSKFSLVQEVHIENEDVTLNFDTELSARIHLAFPNVTKLGLSFTEVSSAALQNMFMEMSNLVELRLINLRSDGNQDPTNWDSALIGTPVKFTEGLRDAPELWDKIQLNNDEVPSIRKLTDLRTLSLEDYSIQDPVLIDVTFQFALLKMAGLQKLEFSGSFSVSAEMVDKWKKSGRVLNYYIG